MDAPMPTVPAVPVRESRVGEIITTVLLGLAAIPFGQAVYVTVFVVPKFKAMFEDFGSKLPLPTQIMIEMSDLIREFWFLAIPLLGTAIVLAWFVTWKVNWRGGLAIAVVGGLLSLAYISLSGIMLFTPLVQVIQDVQSQPK